MAKNSLGFIYKVMFSPSLAPSRLRLRRMKADPTSLLSVAAAVTKT
jgi:hypothetical protein